VDPQFLTDARAAGLTVEPVTAGALEQLVGKIAARPATISVLRSILKPY
jgi:hypothetical protein